MFNMKFILCIVIKGTCDMRMFMTKRKKINTEKRERTFKF